HLRLMKNQLRNRKTNSGVAYCKVARFRLQQFFGGCTPERVQGSGRRAQGFVRGYGGLNCDGRVRFKGAFPLRSKKLSGGEVALKLLERIVGLRISRPGGAFDDRGAAAYSGARDGFIRNAVGGHGIGSVHANDRNAMAKFSE